MSSSNINTLKQLTIRDLQEMRRKGDKFCNTTACDCNTAQMVDEAGIEIIGAGGALVSMVMKGEPNPFRATMEEVLFLLTGVARGTKRAIVSAGLPYGSFQESDAQAIRNAMRLVKAGAHYVKVEGTSDLMLQRMKAMIDVGIPVQGHVGLSPQLMCETGGFRVVGKSAAEAMKVWDDMRRLEDVGVFMVEMECVPYRLAAEFCEKTSMLVTGIGSGPDTHGQALMREDILGLQRRMSPKMVKKFAELWSPAVEALRAFSEETKGNQFPAAEHMFEINDDALAEVLAKIM